MRYFAFFWVLLISCYITGCVSAQQEQALKDIKSQLAELQSRQSKANANLEELSNKFLLLQEQVVINKKGIEELKTMAVPVLPPEELKIIKLETEEAKKETKKETKKTESASSPEALYNEAQNLFIAGRLPESAEQFTDFIERYPRHSLADNAQYWIGEVYYSQKDYQKAAIEFKKVVDNYPNENKAPDALLKAGFSYIEISHNEKAIDALKMVVEQYPASEAAAKAKVKLQELQK